MDIIGVEEDDSYMIDKTFKESVQYEPLTPIYWSAKEMTYIKERSFFVLKKSKKWLDAKLAEYIALQGLKVHLRIVINS